MHYDTLNWLSMLREIMIDYIHTKQTNALKKIFLGLGLCPKIKVINQALYDALGITVLLY